MHIRKGGNRVIAFSMARGQENAGDEVLGVCGIGLRGNARTRGRGQQLVLGGLRGWTSVSGERRACRRVARDSPAAFAERSARRTETAPEVGEEGGTPGASRERVGKGGREIG